MRNEQYNEGEEIIKEQGKKAGRKLSQKATRGIGKGIGKLAKSGIKAGMMAVKSIIAFVAQSIGSMIIMLLPYIIPVIIILGLFQFTWDIEIESRGSQGRLWGDFELNKITDAIIFWDNDEQQLDYFSNADEDSMNRTIRQFYSYFAENAYYQMEVDKDGNVVSDEIKSPDLENKIIDYYKREKMFYLDKDLLFTIDDTLYDSEIKYPEQTVKPVATKKENSQLYLNLNPQSKVNEEGFFTDEKIDGFWDYGLAPIYQYFKAKYYEKYRWKELGQEVYNEETEDVEIKYFYETEEEKEALEIHEEDVADSEKDIDIIKRAITFAGEITWDYEFEEEKILQELRPFHEGKSSTNLSEATKVEYDTYPIYSYRTKTKEKIISKSTYDNFPSNYGESSISDDDKFISSSRKRETEPILDINGKIIREDYNYFAKIRYRERYQSGTKPLYKFREGGVYAYAPRPTNENFNNIKKEYLYNYFSDYKTYVPKDYIGNLNFNKRIDNIIEISLSAGANKLSDEAKTANSQYGGKVQRIITQNNYDIDSKIITAIIAYDASLKDSDDYPNKDRDEIYDNNPSNFDHNGIVNLDNMLNKSVDEQLEEAINRFNTYKIRYSNDTLKAIFAYHIGQERMDMFKESLSNFDDSITWLNEKDEFLKTVDTNTIKRFNPKFVEDVLAYYDGNTNFNQLNDYSTEKPWYKKAWDFFSEKLSTLTLKAKNEDEHTEYVYEMFPEDVDFMLKRYNSFRDNIKFSETNIERDNFWSEGFSLSFETSSLTYAEMLDYIPNLSEYSSPVGIEVNTSTVSSPFGMRMHPTKEVYKMHTGIDLAIITDTPMTAVLDGVIQDVRKSDSGGYGKYVTVRHNNGISTHYAHLDDFPENIRIGERVRQGDIIGYSGNTGESSGPHLHFEVRYYGTRIDPYHVVFNKQI